MFRNQKVGRQNELRRRAIPPNTVIVPDNYQLLITQESLILISNKISAISGKKLTVTEVDNLVEFISILPQGKFYKLTYEEAQNDIASRYLKRDEIKRKLWEENADQHLVDLAHIDDMNSRDSNMEFYQKKEIMQLTDSENQYKFTAFADRRGNAVIDRDRAEGDLSSPNSVPGTGKITPEVLSSATFQTLKTVDSFLSADAVDNMFKKMNQMWTDFDSINLPHQTIQLDSRNRLQTHVQPNEYRWYIHAAGKPGRPGDVQIQDTLQQVISMKINPFWIPLVTTMNSYYQKIRLLIKEFSSQSISVTEYFNPSDNQANIETYHWEFDVVQVDGSRMLLKTKEPLFVFRKPFARVETLTFIFRTPFSIMPLLPDRGIYTVTYGSPTVYNLTSATNNFLSTGDLIYVLNTDSGVTAVNIGLTDPNGFIVTKITDTQFTIPFDSSAAAGSDPGVNIYYGSRRIFNQIEFTSLEQ
jgi:hypothetical protein